MSPRTAASQVRGGVVWGIGAALREASEVDPRYGGFLNADLAEYVLPVNADVGAIPSTPPSAKSRAPCQLGVDLRTAALQFSRRRTLWLL